MVDSRRLGRWTTHVVASVYQDSDYNQSLVVFALSTVGGLDMLLGVLERFVSNEETSADRIGLAVGRWFASLLHFRDGGTAFPTPPWSSNRVMTVSSLHRGDTVNPQFGRNSKWPACERDTSQTI